MKESICDIEETYSTDSNNHSIKQTLRQIIVNQQKNINPLPDVDNFYINASRKFGEIFEMIGLDTSCFKVNDKYQFYDSENEVANILIYSKLKTARTFLNNKKIYNYIFARIKDFHNEADDFFVFINAIKNLITKNKVYADWYQSPHLLFIHMFSDSENYELWKKSITIQHNNIKIQKAINRLLDNQKIIENSSQEINDVIDDFIKKQNEFLKAYMN